MKKILVLSIALIAVIALTAGGTWAYFSDTATSSGNTITAGTLLLNASESNSNTGNYIFSLIKKAPSDKNISTGSGADYITLTNGGNLAGHLSISTSGVTNTEGSDSRFGSPSGGQLGAAVLIAPWIDTNNNGTFDTGTDIALKSDGTTATDKLYWDTVNHFNNLATLSGNSTTGKTWSNVVADMAPGNSYNVYVPWQIPGADPNSFTSSTQPIYLLPTSTTPDGSYDYSALPISNDNYIQGDSFSFNITFTLNQNHS